jgi:hypothetical protein
MLWRTHGFGLNALVVLSKSRAIVDGPRAAIGGGFGESRFGLVSVRWQSESGRLPSVPVMQSADLRDSHDVSIARRSDRAMDRPVLVQRQVSE